MLLVAGQHVAWCKLGFTMSVKLVGFCSHLFYTVSLSTTRVWPLNRVQTHARHSITFNMFLHFVTLWHWPFNHKIITTLVGYPKVIPYTILNTSGSFVFELSRGQTDRQTDAQTDGDERFTLATIVGVSSPHLQLSPFSIQTQSLAFLAVFVYATHATQAIAFEWKPGFSVNNHHQHFVFHDYQCCELVDFTSERHVRHGGSSWPSRASRAVKSAVLLPGSTGRPAAVRQGPGSSELSGVRRCWTRWCSRVRQEYSAAASLPASHQMHLNTYK